MVQSSYKDYGYLIWLIFVNKKYISTFFVLSLFIWSDDDISSQISDCLDTPVKFVEIFLIPMVKGSVQIAAIEELN